MKYAVALHVVAIVTVLLYVVAAERNSIPLSIMAGCGLIACAIYAGNTERKTR